MIPNIDAVYRVGKGETSMYSGLTPTFDGDTSMTIVSLYKAVSKFNIIEFKM